MAVGMRDDEEYMIIEEDQFSDERDYEGSPILYEGYDYYPDFHHRQLILRNRMVILLVWAALVALLAVIVVAPRLAKTAGNLTLETLIAQGNTERTTSQLDTVVQPKPIYSGKISAVFSPSVQYWADKIVEWASVQNLDPNIVATVMQIESCGYPEAESWAGAQGLFQVMPFHFGAGEVMKDPDTNAYRGVLYLAQGLNIAGENPMLAFAGYNGGHGLIYKGQENWPTETQNYYYWAKGIYQDAVNGVVPSTYLNEWLTAGGSGLCHQANLHLGLE